VQTQVDGWSLASGPTPRLLPKAEDPPSFVNIGGSGRIIMVPRSVWTRKKDGWKRNDTLAGPNSISNMFTMPGGAAETMAETGSGTSRPSSVMTRVGPGAGDTPVPQRGGFELLQRQEPVGAESEVNGGPADPSREEGGDDATPAMSEGEANKKIAGDIKELFAICDIDESEYYFTNLPPEHHHRLVEEMVSKAVASKETDGKLVADAFARAVEKGLCSISAFEEGFLPVAELLDDIAIDAPKAIQIMATVIKGAGLDKDEERRTMIAQKSMDGDTLLELLA